MQVAIVGAGIAGLTAAYKLSKDHQVTVFEAGSYAGGHVNTVSVEIGDEEHHIDTGFIVFNDRTYPYFCGLLDDLGVESLPTSMSFSVRCDRSGLEYNGTSLNGLFAQRRNLARPSFLRMLRDILSFNRTGPKDMGTVAEELTVGEYLRLKGYSQQFMQQYLLPMGAAIWSCPTHCFEKFPIRFILEFYLNHGLLSLNDRPQWKVIQGGSRRYVDRLIAPFADRIRLKSPIRSVRRLEDAVLLTHDQGSESFDEVIIACHSDQALRLLADADAIERELLSAFPYSQSTAVLHTDISVLPRNRRAWASWNYHIASDSDCRPTLTYNMNMLQHLRSKHTFCVTLNEEQAIDPSKIIASFSYSHPVFTVERARVQRCHANLIRHRRTSYCGAYWRNGFHEDGVCSALAVSQAFQSSQNIFASQHAGEFACY